jgi:ABC-type methionine transport system ATPase subunit
MAAMSSARLHLTFPEHLISEPVVHRLGADFDLVTNIRRANLDEDRGGWVILEVEGADDRIAAAVTWLAEQGLQVDRIG